MSSDLHEQLADLAGRAPTPAPGGAGALWAAGKRRQRRRAAIRAAAVMACLLVVVGAGGLLRSSPDAVVPSEEPGARGALPARLYVPSKWTGSNEDDPVGPFAVVSSAERGWRGRTAYFGVSSGTGEYRFVDLPDLLGGDTGGSEPLALSPTGRYLAYWIAGDVPDGADPFESPAVGIAVYNTTTGEVERQRISSAHGLLPWDMFWVDEDRLYLQAGDLLEPPGTEDGFEARAKGAGWVWHLGKGSRLRPLDVPGIKSFGDVQGSDERGHLLMDAPGRGSKHLLVDPDRPQHAREVNVRLKGVGGTAGPYRVSTEGRVAVAASEETGALLAVSSPDGTSRKFPDLRAWGVAGWSDAQHVVAGVTVGEGADRQTAFAKVDIATGQAEPIVAMPAEHLNPPLFATSLLGVPTMARGEPGTPGTVYVFWGFAALVGSIVALRVVRGLRARR